MTARRNARPPVKIGAQVRFRGVKWQVVALSGQVIYLVGPDGGGEAGSPATCSPIPASASSGPM